MRRYGVSLGKLANHGSSRHFQISGDIKLASTSGYIRLGNTKISMSEKVYAEETSSSRSAGTRGMGR